MVTAVLLLALANSFPWTLATAAALLLFCCSAAAAGDPLPRLVDPGFTTPQRVHSDCRTTSEGGEKGGKEGGARIGQADGKQRRAASPAFTH